MCGIFGFVLKQPIPMAGVFEVLARLEVHQYPREKKPVGGFGAGIAVLMDDGSIMCEKVGKVADSPVKQLSEIVRVDEACVLAGHVRMPSPQFMATAQFSETAQPYIAKCLSDLLVVSVHNGFVKNYLPIKDKLATHAFESDNVGFVDSEIVPHFFEHLVKENASVDKALDLFFSGLDGNNTVGLWHIAGKCAFLHLIHKGKTRGLTIWVNRSGEVLFCSRKEPVVEVWGDLLKKGKFSEKVSVSWQENASMMLSFPLIS